MWNFTYSLCLTGEYASIHQLPVGRESYLKYMADGGYPELVHFQSSDVKRNYISGLKDTVLLKDIIRRYTIRDVRLLEDLFAYLVNNLPIFFLLPILPTSSKSKGRRLRMIQYLYIWAI